MTDKTHDNQYVEIDLMQLFVELKKHFLTILLVTLCCGAIGGAISRFCITPKFQSTALLYILSKETTLTSLADLQIGSQLTNDYSYIVKSRPVLEQVISDESLSLTFRQLRQKLTITNPQSTRILEITVTDPNPMLCKQIADAIARVSSDYIGETMEMVPPKIIETGEIPTEKSSPSNGKNALLGAAIGFLLICAFYTVTFLLNDTVSTEEDVHKYLGLSVLASVPEREEDSTSEKEKNEQKKDKHRRSRKRVQK